MSRGLAIPVHREHRPEGWVAPLSPRDIYASRWLHAHQRPSINMVDVTVIFESRISEEHRAVMAEVEIVGDMKRGDVSRVLGKARYVIEFADHPNTFKDPAMQEFAVLKMIDLIRRYGEPEGVAILKEALIKYGSSPAIRKAVASVLADIGFSNDLKLIINLFVNGAHDPAQVDSYLSDVANFLQRYPSCKPEAIEHLTAVAASIGISNQNAAARILGAVEELQRNEKADSTETVVASPRPALVLVYSREE